MHGFFLYFFKLTFFFIESEKQEEIIGEINPYTGPM